jgi:hypothetical protein
VSPRALLSRGLFALSLSLALLWGCGIPTDPQGAVDYLSDNTPVDCGQGLFRAIAAGKANDWGCTTPAPTPGTQSLTPESFCAAEVGDGTCATCLKASCCVESQACDEDEDAACFCGVACLASGSSQTSCSCAAADTATDAALACASAHCATQCPVVP